MEITGVSFVPQRMRPPVWTPASKTLASQKTTPKAPPSRYSVVTYNIHTSYYDTLFLHVARLYPICIFVTRDRPQTLNSHLKQGVTESELAVSDRTMTTMGAAEPTDAIGIRPVSQGIGQMS